MLVQIYWRSILVWWFLRNCEPRSSFSSRHTRATKQLSAAIRYMKEECSGIYRGVLQRCLTEVSYLRAPLVNRKEYKRASSVKSIGIMISAFVFTMSIAYHLELFKCSHIDRTRHTINCASVEHYFIPQCMLNSQHVRTLYSLLPDVVLVYMAANKIYIETIDHDERLCDYRWCHYGCK